MARISAVREKAIPRLNPATMVDALSTKDAPNLTLAKTGFPLFCFRS